MPAALVAGSTLVAAVGARLLERVWFAEVLGGAVSATSVGVPAAGDGFVRGRVDGFVMTWLTPGYGGSPVLVVTLLVMLGGLCWCALRVRTHPQDRTGILAGAAVAAAAAVVALAVAPTNVVPGLLLAFPVATAGMLALRRRLFASDSPGHVGMAVAGATAALFTLAVLATQYAVGGSAEWGGRYFALVIPVVVPLLLAALRLEGRSLEPTVRKAVAAGLVVCSVALSVMAVTALRANHRTKADLVARIEDAGRATGDQRPVVVTTSVGISRLAWPTFDDHRWLSVPKDDLATATGRLRDAGIDRFVLVTTTADLPVVRPLLDDLTIVSSEEPDGRGDRCWSSGLDRRPALTDCPI